MSNLRQAAQQALEALEGNPISHAGLVNTKQAITALRAALKNEFNPDWDQVEALEESLREYMAEVQRLRAALAEPDQEPVAWMYDCGNGGRMYAEELDGVKGWMPLYTAPPQRKPLTKQEIWKIHDLCIPPTEGYVSPVEFTRAIEQAHGIKGEA